MAGKLSMKKLNYIICALFFSASAQALTVYEVDVEKVVQLVEISGINGKLCAASYKLDRNTCNRAKKAMLEMKDIFDKHDKAGTQNQINKVFYERLEKDRMFSYRYKRFEEAVEALANIPDPYQGLNF